MKKLQLGQEFIKAASLFQTLQSSSCYPDETHTGTKTGPPCHGAGRRSRTAGGPVDHLWGSTGAGETFIGCKEPLVQLEGGSERQQPGP